MSEAREPDRIQMASVRADGTLDQHEPVFLDEDGDGKPDEPKKATKRAPKAKA